MPAPLFTLQSSGNAALLAFFTDAVHVGFSTLGIFLCSLEKVFPGQCAVESHLLYMLF